MKNLLLAILFLAAATISAQSATDSLGNATLTVEVENAKSDEGQMFIAVYDSEGTWLSTPLKGAIESISEGKSTCVINNLPEGIFAVSIFHDLDSDGKLNTGFMGIPTEPYASSMGAKGFMGPPKWEDAKFELGSEPKTITIKF